MPAFVLAVFIGACTHRESVPAPLQPFTVTPDEAFRNSEPPLEPNLGLRPPTQRSVVLENGMRLIVVERHELPIASLVFANRAARDGESVAQLGLAAVTASTLDSGTLFENGQVVGQLRFDGRPVAVTVIPDGTLVKVEAFSTTLPEAVRLLGRWVRYPSLTDAALGTAVSEQLSPAKSPWNDLLLQMKVAALEGLYGKNQPTAVWPFGIRAHWGKPALTEVQNFYRNTYQPETSALVVVGDVKAESVIELARAQFGSWPASSVPAVTDPLPKRLAHGEIEITGFARNSSQTWLAAAIPCPGLADPDAIAGDLLAIVLGQMTLSRTAVRLRHETGASYASSATCTQRRNFGELMVVAAADNDHAGFMLGTILGEIRNLKTVGISPEELATAKARLLARYAEEIASSPGLATSIALNFLNGGPNDFYETLASRIWAVTSERARAAAARYFDEASLGVAVSGSPMSIEGQLEIYGKIRWDVEQRSR